jgi:hypothetical protein
MLQLCFYSNLNLFLGEFLDIETLLAIRSLKEKLQCNSNNSFDFFFTDMVCRMSCLFWIFVINIF